jgi:CubicO group peptidase (beta-lactamase class C family)
MQIWVLMGMLAAAPLAGCGAEDQASCPAGGGADLVARWDALLAGEAQAGFSGAVLAGGGAGVRLAKEYGAAAHDDGSTAFWIASTSKAVTATAVLRLIDEGRASLHDSLPMFLPAVPDRWRGVTIHHLLSHRSGLPHAYAADGIADRGEASDAIMGLRPGTSLGSFEYSNDGYTLLAILIELISGEPFEDFVRRAVFTPAGMAESGFWGFEAAGARIAPPAPGGRPARMRPTIWRAGHSVANWGYRGPTGIYSTPGDLYRFARAVSAGTLLSRASQALMLSAKNPALPPDAQSYGYGWALTIRGGAVVEHWHRGNEDWLGHTSSLRVSGDRILVVLSNAGDVGGQSWAARVEDGLRACEQQAR